MTYRVITGQQSYTGSPAEILGAMSRDQWYTGRRSTDWMGDVAVRVKAQTGAQVRVTDARTFLEDLAGAGLIRLEQV